MSINIPQEIDQIDATLRQKLVAAYLKGLGVPLNLVPTQDKHSLTFKAIGSQSYSGHIFPNGKVYIFSEHKAPFQSATTRFEDVMKKAYAPNWMSICNQVEKIEPLPQSESPLEVDRRIKVRLCEEKEPPPEHLAIVPSYVTERGIKPSIWTWDEVVGWIKSPPMSWLKVKRRGDMTRLKRFDTPAIVHTESELRTIGWLDIDGKENDPETLEVEIERMKTDERVFAIYRSLSGNGYAVGVGIKCVHKSDYQKIMKRVITEFSHDYGGIQIDSTCSRWSQKRGLSEDPDMVTHDTAYYYEGIPMEAKIEETRQTIDANQKIANKMRELMDMVKTETPIATTMLELLDKVYEKLQIHISEDAWTGQKRYYMHGQRYPDDNALYLAILSELKSTEENAYNLHKTEICDYMRTKVDVEDSVREVVLGGRWDGVNRWPQMRAALHLDHWDLRFFQLWFRQGVALLHNNGSATDVQRNFMLILYSKNQHIGKTELVKKISCGTGSFTQKSLDTRNKDAMMTIYSNWIYEYGELGTQFRKNDINTLKSFITDSAVSYRRPYDREATLYPVRTSIIGTTNEEDLFVDPSGNRRYLIITCNWTRADWPAINAIDFVQLWRQARVEWMEGDDYILSLEDQRYNETRCMNKRVITTEMYAIIDAIIAAKKSGFKGLYRIDEKEGKVIINLLGLLKMVKDQWRDAKMYNLTRELEAMGFKRDRNRLGDNFIIDKDAFEAIVAGRQTPVP